MQKYLCIRRHRLLTNQGPNWTVPAKSPPCVCSKETFYAAGDVSPRQTIDFYVPASPLINSKRLVFLSVFPRQTAADVKLLLKPKLVGTSFYSLLSQLKRKEPSHGRDFVVFGPSVGTPGLRADHFSGKMEGSFVELDR